MGNSLDLRCVHRLRSWYVRTSGKGKAPSLTFSENDQKAINALRGHEVAVQLGVLPSDDLDVFPVRLGEHAVEDIVSSRVQVAICGQKPPVTVADHLVTLSGVAIPLCESEASPFEHFT